MKDIICTTRSIGVVLNVLLLAVLVAACGSSGSSGKGSPVPSTPAPSATADLAAYDLDGGGITGASDIAQQAGYTPRYTGDEIFDRLNGGYALVEKGMPSATDLNQVETGEPGAIGGDTSVLWEPSGRRDTLLPTSAHGERIYAVVVDLDGYFQGGDATARISFVSRAQGDLLNLYLKDPTATAGALPPDQIYTYKVDKATAAALVDYFFVKGAAPTESPAESPTDG